MPWLGLRRAPVSRTCHTHARTSWCCCYGVAVLRVVLLLRLLPAVALSSLVTCNEKTKRKRKKANIKTDLLWIQKKKTYSSTRSWKNKKTINETTKKTGDWGERKSPKPKKANNFGRVPQQIISSSAIAVWEGMFMYAHELGQPKSGYSIKVEYRQLL